LTLGSKLSEPFDEFPGFHVIGKLPPLGDRRIQAHHMALDAVALDAVVKIVKVGVQLAIVIALRQTRLHSGRPIASLTSPAAVRLSHRSDAAQQRPRHWLEASQLAVMGGKVLRQIAC
jgi:hypothetical protein